MNQFHYLVKSLAAIILLHFSLLATAHVTTRQLGPGEKKITLIAKDMPVSEILKSISKQTGLRFSYNNKDINLNERITAPFVDLAVDKVLKHIFAGKALSWFYTDNIIRIGKSDKDQGLSMIRETAGSNSNADTVPLVDITGRVVDSRGRAIAGATVSLHGKGRGQGTDEAGRFSFFGVPSNGVLRVSSIGFESKQIKLAGQSDIQVSLDSLVREIQAVEIVSTGYQDIPKERATGSFTKVDNATLNQQVGTNILKRLDGVTSGLQFVNKTDRNRKLGMSIRGLSSINGPLDPLIVLDGFIYEGNINNINPNDIDNITVLKDAAAASIWGARAGNGVVVITTQKGKFNQKPQLSFNSNISVRNKPDLFYLPQLSTIDYIEFEQFLFNRGYFDSNINNTSIALTNAVEVFLDRRNRKITPADSALRIDALKQIDSRNEYLNNFYATPVTQQYALSLRGGNPSNAYAFSVGYDRATGDLYDKNSKLNIRAENIYRPLKNLTISTGVYFTNSTASSGRLLGFNNVTINSRLVPYMKFSDENGSLAINTKYRGSYTDTAGAGKLQNWKYFPLEEYKYIDNTTKLQEYFINMGVQYILFKGLNAEIKYQYQNQKTDLENISTAESFFARDIVNTFSQLNRTTGEVKYIVPLGGVKLGSNSYVKSYTARGQLSYNNAWGIHNVSGVLGAEVRESQLTGNALTVYGYKSDPLSFVNVDYAGRYPTFINGSQSGISGGPSFTDITNRFVSMYGNVAYTLVDRYTVSASARNDGSNIFGVKTNDRWKPLWSAGVSWKISNEPFYNFSLLSNVNLRTTYGYSGNVDLSRSALPVAAYSTNSTTGLATARISTISNPQLKWEQIGIFNVGLDFSMGGNKLNGSIEYYSKKGSDLYGPSPFDYTGWGVASTIVKNVANIKGTGVDLMLNSVNINTNNFRWTSTFLFNYAMTKVTNYFSAESQQISSLLGGGNIIVPVVGKPMYSIAAYKWGGLDTLGRPQGYENAKLSVNYTNIEKEGKAKGLDGNIVYFGSAVPTHFGSLINTFTYKGISLNLNIGYRFGYYFKKPALSYSALVGGGPGHQEYANRWKKRGDELITNVPSFRYPVDSKSDVFYNLSEVNVLKGDHIRLQYISLSYALSKERMRALPFRDLQVYVNVADCGILWRANKENLDPDFPSSIPPSKTFSIGIRGNL